MKKIDILRAMTEDRAKFWPAQDALVIERPGHPIRVFRKDDDEYTAACNLIDADLATQTYVDSGKHIPLVATDKGKELLAHADRANPRRHGSGRTRAGVLA